MRAKTSLTLIVAGLAVLLFLMIGFSGVSQQDQRPDHCESDAGVAAQPREPGVLVRDQDRSAERDNDKGRVLEKEQALASRQECQQGATPSWHVPLQILVAALVFGVGVLAALLAHWTTVEERPTKRGRLIPVFPDERLTVIRIENVGETAVWLTGAGWSAGSHFGQRQRLKAVSRLVPKGREGRLDFAFNPTRVADEERFSILLRYRDAYGEEWQARRVFRMSRWRVTVEEDDESPGDSVDRRRHGWFPLMIMFLFLLSTVFSVT